MPNLKKKIFILEDDETLVQALTECFERADLFVQSSKHPHEASAVLKDGKFDFIVVDCLLPQTTGVNFIVKAQAQGIIAKETKIILTSGIYTDKDFIQESIHQTKAIGFIKKPMNLDELLEIIKKNTVDQKVDISARKRLYQIFSKEKVSTREKRKLIEYLDEVNGFDLPFIYSLLVESKSSGYLNIYAQNGSVSGITFSQGNIISVDIDDQRTFLGEMLIQQGYILSEDLKEALKDKSNKRKLGEKLIEQNLMSPHALDIVLREQMNIRLSRTIEDEKIKINFVATETDLTNPYIDSDRLAEYLHDWIASKISTSWLKRHYLNLGDHVLVVNDSMVAQNPALEMSLVKNLPQIMSRLAEGKTIRQLSAIPNYNENALYKAVHFLLTKGIILLGPKAVYQSDKDVLNSLQQIWDDYTKLKDLEIFEGLTDGTGDVETNIQNIIGAEPATTKTQIYEVWKKIHDKSILVHKQLNQSSKKDVAEEDKKKNAVEARIQTNKLIDEARVALQFHRYAEAIKLLSKATSLSQDVPRLHMYTAWAKLGTIDPAKKTQILKDVELEILQIPPDEKFDATFTFVMGLFYKHKGDNHQAKKNFEKAVGMDSSMIIAKRELTMLSGGKKEGKQDLLSMDLKDVINGFFKKGNK